MDMGEVERAIAQLEAGNTTFANCAKLADLYAVRDHHESGGKHSRSYSAATPQETIPPRSGSKFMQAISGKDQAAVFAVLDELMATLSLVNPRSYDNVIRKLEHL